MNLPASTTWQFTACGDAIQITNSILGTELYSTLSGGGPIPITSYNSCSAPNAVQSNFPVVVEPNDQTTGSTPTTPVTLILPNVSQSTQITLTSSTPPPQNPPGGFEFGTPPVYFDLQPSLTFSSTAPATICINYGATTFKNASSVTLQHYVNGAWVNLVAPSYTVSLDTVNHVLCVSGVTSFSPFALVEPVSAPANPSVNLVTTLAASLPLAVDGKGNYIATLVVTNEGNTTAVGTGLAGATLVVSQNGKAVSTPTSTPLPATLGDIVPGGSVTVPVSFPASAGAPGSAGALRVSLTYSGGSASGALRLTLP